MSLDWSQCPAVESIPGKVSGAWVLQGTRTPVKILFENLEAGMSIKVSTHGGGENLCPGRIALSSTPRS